MLFALFYVEHLYYLPHFLSLYKKLKNAHLPCKIYLKSDDHFANITDEIIEDEALDPLEDIENFKCYYLICGNNLPKKLAHQKGKSFQKSVLIFHGIGTKAAYIKPELNDFDIRFIEGAFKTDDLLRRYPLLEGKLFPVGFSKMDTRYDFDKEQLYTKFRIDPTKKTILYAPTFYPSSLENMSDDFPKEFANYNILIKPHFFTFTDKKYRHQRQKLEHWQQQSNVYVASLKDYNLIPFLIICDVMVSDESSAIFEGAALERPIIWNRFIHLRWSYRLLPYRFKKRMDSAMDRFRDIGENVMAYQDLQQAVSNALNTPQNYSSQRATYTQELIGNISEDVSEKMMKILLRLYDN